MADMDAELWTAVDDHLTTTLLGPDPDLDAALADSSAAGLPACLLYTSPSPRDS